jgi:formylglycine-generating enzyme required for sulfatase activity
MTLIACDVLITEPLRIHIATDWFSMGSDVGQSVVGPVHCVWLDSFAVAATQVTVEEYARFLDATGRMPQAPEEGHTQLAIAEKVGIGAETVSRWSNAPQFPERFGELADA